MVHIPSKTPLAAILGIHVLLLVHGASVHSPTLDEPAHLVAGIWHWTFGRFDLYRVNPPLVRMWATAPILALDYEADWRSHCTQPGIRPEFGMGEDFFRANRNRAMRILILARFACIPFSLLGAFVCYRWAAMLAGDLAGILAMTLWCFSPNIVAHAQLITADAPASSLAITASYCFSRWLRHPSWGETTLCGMALGLALLTKTTLIVFLGIQPAVWIICRLFHRSFHRSGGWLPETAKLMTSLMIGIFVLNLGYGFCGSFKQIGRFAFVSSLLSAPSIHDSSRTKYQLTSNCLSGTLLGSLPAPFPEDYILGVDIQQRDFEDIGRTSYLAGEFRDRGWWYYYLYGLTVKVPLGTWLLASIAAVGRLLRKCPVRNLQDDLVLLLVPAMLLALVSSRTGFSQHFRYALPCLPFMFVWVGSAVVHTLSRSRQARYLATVAVVWFATSSLSIYPHSLSYFNELAGGPIGGPRHLLDSNIDWGQDLTFLRAWMRDHTDAQPIYLAYYGSLDPSLLGITTVAPFPRVPELGKLPNGYYAISVNLLQGAPYLPRGGASGPTTRLSESVLTRLRRQPWIAGGGYSIRIFSCGGPPAEAKN